MKTRFCFLILVLFLAAAQLSAQNYTVTDLGTLGGNYSGAAAINNLGQVAGTSTNASNQTLATLFSGTGTGNINLGTLGGDTSYATAINDNGTIVGYSYFDVSFIFHATQFSGTGNGNIDLAGPGAASVPSFANGINQSGTVVGYRFNGANANAVLFGPNGVGNVLLGTLGGSPIRRYGDQLGRTDCRVR